MLPDLSVLPFRLPIGRGSTSEKPACAAGPSQETASRAWRIEAPESVEIEAADNATWRLPQLMTPLDADAMPGALQALLGKEGVLALRDLGLQRAREGRKDEAVGLLKTAVAMLPLGIERAHLLVVVGQALAYFDQHEQALTLFDEALDGMPDVPDALLPVDVAFDENAFLPFDPVDPMRRLSQSEIAWLHAERCMAYALSLCALGRAHAALTMLDTGLPTVWIAALGHDMQSRYALARARTLLALHRPVDALAVMDALGGIDETTELGAEANLLRAAALLALHRPMLAIAPLESYLTASPNEPAAFVLYGQALTSLGEPAFAVDRFEQALRVAPSFAPAYRYMASALVMQKLDQEALSCLRAARRLKPDWPEAWLDEAGIRLRRGELARGFAAYEWREGARHAASHGAAFWNGDDALEGQSILILAEQGLGDTLHFIRYVPMIVALAGEVVVEVPVSLKRLLNEFGRRAGFRVITSADPRPACERFTLLMSLPHAVNTRMGTIPAAVPYLAAPTQHACELAVEAACDVPMTISMTAEATAVPAHAQHANIEVGKARGQRCRVGIVPAGNPAYANDAIRSMPLSAFAPLLARDDIDAVLLQAAPREADRAWADAHPEWIAQAHLAGDFADTAEVIAKLDLVITVDTALAHLTGAMGLPVWIVLAFVADWRWMENRNDSPWYPSATLYRQTTPRDWETVVAALCRALDELSIAR